MSSTYSSNLRIELIGSGDQAGAWGATTDSNLAYIMDTAIAGYQAVTITSTSQALTYVNGPSSTANLNQAVYAMLSFTGASANSSVYAPPASKQYILWNNTSYTITIYNSTVIGNTTAAGTGVTLAAGDKIMVWSDATNFYDVKAQGLTATLPINKGGTGQTTANAAFNALAPAQTANRLLKSDGTNTSFAQAVLTTDVTGTLPLANGGTGQTTAQAAMNALAGTQTNNRVLRSDGTNTTLSQVVLTTDVSGTLPVTNGGTGAATFTSGVLLQGNGTAAVTAATAANIVSAIGSTAVTLSTDSTNALGYNQTWQAVTRAENTTYTNSTGKPIAWYWAVTSGGNTGQCSVQFTIAGSVTWTASFYCTSGYTIGGEIIIPAGTTYRFQIGGYAGGSAGQSYELR